MGSPSMDIPSVSTRKALFSPEVKIHTYLTQYAVIGPRVVNGGDEGVGPIAINEEGIVLRLRAMRNETSSTPKSLTEHTRQASFHHPINIATRYPRYAASPHSVGTTPEYQSDFYFASFSLSAMFQASLPNHITSRLNFHPYHITTTANLSPFEHAR